jgi:hypothetical protein
MPQAAVRIAPSSFLADSARQGGVGRASAEVGAGRPRSGATDGRSIPGAAFGRAVVSSSFASPGPGARFFLESQLPKIAAPRRTTEGAVRGVAPRGGNA